VTAAVRRSIADDKFPLSSRLALHKLPLWFFIDRRV
jgi:hypothetical protein